MEKNKYNSVSEIPPPENLTELQEIEFQAFKESLCSIENEWFDLMNDNKNNYQKECIQILDEIKKSRKQQATERLNLRLQIIDQQVERDSARIELENDMLKEAFYDRIMRAYFASYQSLLNQLKELLPEQEYQAYIRENAVEFPPFPDDSTMKTRLQETENLKIRLTLEEIEADLHAIQSKFSKED